MRSDWSPRRNSGRRVGTILGIDARSAKDRLNLIVIRRNQIAHEADIEPSYAGGSVAY